MTEKFSLKDHLFNKKKVEYLAQQIHSVYPTFPKQVFIRDVVHKFPQLELKERIRWIQENLFIHLPKEFNKAVTIILRSLPPPCDPSKKDNDFGDFIFAPYNLYVAVHGCNRTNLHTSLNALKEITQRFSAEDAIRPFLNTYQKETLATLKKWTKDPHYHVRRLVSEGTRPKLPWAEKISVDHNKAIPFLDKLYTDETRFVTRSVANHMNDISKIDPALCIKTLERWKQEHAQDKKELQFIIKHSLRTLIKKGDPQAMKLLGFSPSPKITVSPLHITKKSVAIGESLEFSFTVTAKKSESLVIDYIVHFKTKNNKLSPKVYKLKQIALTSGDKITVEKKHLFKKNMSTRSFYPGEHKIQIQINGQIVGNKAFFLRA